MEDAPDTQPFEVDDIIMAPTPTGDPRLNSDDEGDAKSSAGMSSAVTVYSEIVLSNKEKLFEKAFQEFKSHGGVRQYLHRTFHDPTTRVQDLSTILYDLVPADQSVDYLMDYPIPACFPGQEEQQQAFILHIAKFSVMNESSLREPTALETSRRLLQQFAIDGFVSSGDPVMIRLEAAADSYCGSIPNGGIWLLKGAARVHTAIALVVFRSKTTTSSSEAFDSFMVRGLSQIYCKHVRLADRQAELFYNMKSSVRGSIRKAPSVISWVCSFINLTAWQRLDAGSMIKAWNNEAGKDEKLAGPKKQAVTIVLELPLAARDLLLATVSEWGFEGSLYSDDCLGSNKIVPGYVFRSRKSGRTSPWLTRGKVTKESLMCLFKMIRAQHVQNPRTLRKNQIEEKSEVCALACALVEEVVAQVPNSEQVLQQQFIGKLCAGDSMIEMELQRALMQKDDKYTARDNASIASILNDLSVGAHGKTTSVELQSALEINEAKMVGQQFELMMTELEYDRKSWHVYQRKIREWDLRIMHQKDTWQIQRHEAAKKAANAILDAKVNLIEWPEKIIPGTALELIQTMAIDSKRWMSQLKCTHLAQLFVLNYASPSLIRNDCMACASKILGHSMVANASDTLGIALSPLFNYKVGTLYMDEFGFLKTLHSDGCAVDSAFSLIFDLKSKTDQRDSRPLVYPGRLLNAAGDTSASSWLWKGSYLVKNRRTIKDPPQLAPKDMLQIEEVGKLPQVNVDQRVKGAIKFAQVGKEDGVAWGPSTCLHIVDFVPVAGDFAQGALSLSFALNTPIKYTAVVEPSAHEWLIETLSETLTQQLLEGHVAVPSGHTVGPVDPPPEHMEAKPEPPVMKKLVFLKVDSEVAGIAVPDNVTKQWHGHPTHGSEFAAWLETFQEENPKPEKGKKRGSGTTNPQQPPRKIGRTDPKPFDVADFEKLLKKEEEEPGNTVLQRVSLLNLPSVDLVIQAGAVFLKDVGEQKVSISAGTVLAGFGKGKFRHAKEDVAFLDSEIEFLVSTPEDAIGIMDGNPKSIGEYMEAQRSKSPDKPALCYHEATFDLVERKWTVKQVASVIFQPNLEEEKGSQTTCAKACHSKTWQSSWTSLGWHLKSTINGLQPVRPVVVTSKAIELEPKAILLVG